MGINLNKKESTMSKRPLDRIQHRWSYDERGRDVLRSTLVVSTTATIDGFSGSGYGEAREQLEAEAERTIARALYGETSQHVAEISDAFRVLAPMVERRSRFEWQPATPGSSREMRVAVKDPMPPEFEAASEAVAALCEMVRLNH